MIQYSHRNKVFPLLLMCLFAITGCFFKASAQKKMFVWAPEAEKYFPTNILQGVTVNLEIKDARIITPDSKVKASFEEISNEIFNAINQTYGKSFVNSVSEKKVVISVQAYDVTLYPGMWHAQTRYAIKTGEKEDIIEQLNNEWNAWGYPSAKKALNRSFAGANMKLFQFLNENLVHLQ